MMSFLKKYSDILIILVLLVFTVSPLFVPGWFPVHDDEQIGRLFELNKDVVAGQLPPRLSQDLGFGFDYPLFNFYPSFVYYIAEIFHLLGFSYITSTKLMIGLGFLLAGVAMYIFAKEYVGRKGAIVAAIAYCYAPYHSVDVYVRGALPEFWAFVFVPLIFWSYAKLAQKNNYVYVLVSAIFVACLALTHDLILMMSSFFLAGFFIYLLLLSKNRKELFIKICISVALGLAFCAYFWLPGYLEKGYTMVYLLTQQSADYHQHFVCIKQFFDSPWGYGGSVPGCFDGLSFQVGQAQFVLAFISLAFSAFFILKKRKGYGLGILFIILFVFSLFIQTKYSVFIWDRIPQFAYIQFPWRFLIFSDFTIALLVAYVFSQIKKEKIQLMIAVVMILLLIVMNKDFFRPSKYLRSVTDENYISLSVIQWKTSAMSYEYTPIGISTVMGKYGDTIVNIDQNELPEKDYSVISGKMSVTAIEDIPQQKEFQVSVLKQGMFRFNTYTFPGWKTFIDNKAVAYSANNKYKLITITVPRGEHTLRATFTDTPIRTIANDISAISVIGAIVYVILRRKKYDKNK
jgi:uncharacterized membrane protein